MNVWNEARNEGSLKMGDDHGIDKSPANIGNYPRRIEKTAEALGPRIEATLALVSAYVQGNRCPPEQLPDLVRSVHGLLAELDGAPLGRPLAGAAVSQHHALAVPAVPVDQSVQYDHIICLEDGKRLKLLKRYLSRAYGLTPEQYRLRWGLPADYPMVAPMLSERRTVIAHSVKPHLTRHSKEAPPRRHRLKAKRQNEELRP